MTMSVCHLAARLSLPHIVKAILENGLDTTNAEGFESRGLTALHWAAKFADEATLRVLVESGADIDARNAEGVTPLYVAARNWDGEHVVAALLDLGADITLTDSDGRTPLHIAAQNGYGHNSVLLLLQRGASIRASCNVGQLPLHVAAANPYGVTSVKHLLSYGADANAPNGRWRTPLHVAAGVWYRGIDSVEVLVEIGAANVDVTDPDGLTPLHMAAQSVCGGECVKFLLEHGAKVDAVSKKERRTPLHMAARSPHSHDAVRYLLENGANVEATDSLMQTPLHLAVTVVDRDASAEVVRTLLAYRANVNAKTQKGQTALHVAVLYEFSWNESSWRAFVRTLLQHGADPNIVDAEGRSVFDCATYRYEFLKLLVYQVT
jgi:ankyrin repeat protein